MYVIALTGGIGSGKSEAARQFAKLGVPIVDTDVISHELTAAGNPMLNKIAQTFGATFFNADGTLNRAGLRAHILNNPSERLKLEALLHPAIHDRAVELLTKNQNTLHPDYQMLVIPLLFENNRYQTLVDKVLVVDCDENMQIKRTMTRSQLTEQEVQAIMEAQTTRAARLKLADEVIENNGSMTELINKVNKLHKKFIKTCIVSK